MKQSPEGRKRLEHEARRIDEAVYEASRNQAESGPTVSRGQGVADEPEGVEEEPPAKRSRPGIPGSPAHLMGVHGSVLRNCYR